MTREKIDASNVEAFYFRIKELPVGEFVKETSSSYMCNIDKDKDGNIVGIEVLI